MERETIRIKYHCDELQRLTYIAGKSDWIDLRAAEEVVLKKGEFRMICLGVSMQLPRGYEAVIVPRSSTYKNFGIIQTNHMGVVDESYCGDHDVWKMPVLAVREGMRRSLCRAAPLIRILGSFRRIIWASWTRAIAEIMTYGKCPCLPSVIQRSI